jgi:N-acetylglucosamine kinase-like BadF-type ATPase
MMGIVIGVDAGGSRTRVSVADSDGEIIATAEREGAAVRPGEVERSAAIIAAAVRDALVTLHPSFGAPRALCAGVAGVGRESERRALREALMIEALAEDVLVVTDAEIALADAFGDESGLHRVRTRTCGRARARGRLGTCHR